MMKKISVIVPIYNSSIIISKCLDSLLNQTYKNLEILLIDDGSTDNSYKLCEFYAKKDKRVKIFHKENGGVSSARNLGLDNATGDYISFVDSDDYIENNTYEVLMNNISDNDIIIFNMFHEDCNQNTLYKFEHTNCSFIKKEYPELSFYNPSISGYVCNKLFSKRVIYYDNNKHIEFDNQIYMLEDDLFNYNILEKNSNINYLYLNTKLYHYVRNDNSATLKTYNLKKLSYFDSREKEIAILKKFKMNCDFLKADYVINYVRSKIMIYKNKIISDKKFNYISAKSNTYKREINYSNLCFKLKIKLIIALYFPTIYKIKLRNNKS